jgi:methionyl aminopeptidase
VIIIKNDKQILLMRRAGRITAEILEALAENIKPGIKTKELDSIAERELVKREAKSSFKGYHGFPGNLCVSINDEVVHGIPDEHTIQEGDIVSLDFGAVYNGWQGDSALTLGVGGIDPEVSRLIEVTREALVAGIGKARRKARLGDISAAIQSYVEDRGFFVVREYTGHGIGREMHEDPSIPNFGVPGTGPRLEKGMTLAIEPMVNAGGWRTKLASNGWTVLTRDGSLSAHFEHTILITQGEAEILTVA